MPLPIEQYAMIGDCHTAALVGSDGSLDWLCLPRFDSPACFAALLGEPKHGRWLIAPTGEVTAVRRRYREDTLVLETELETAEGCVRLIDFMTLSEKRMDIVRIVEGVRGQVPMHTELVVRFDYGQIVPWVRRVDEVLQLVAGPDALELDASIELKGENMRSVGEWTLKAGQRQWFTLNYHPSFHPRPERIDAAHALRDTEEAWRRWSARCTLPEGPWRAPVMRSLLTLRALIFRPTGGIIAAPTTSLPERLGGVRNWDYRYCWLRDATFTLNALLVAGYVKEATEWREWLLRAVAGSPDDLQILYSVTGVRRLDEVELGWLPGYRGARPVRIGNAASRQFQLDVYGEVMDTLHLARLSGIAPEPEAWNVQTALIEFLETHWQEPDDGIWEVRGARQHFTHSKIMAWVAFDRAIKDAQQDGLEAPLDRWKATRDAIHREVCSRGFNREKNAFVQSYETAHLDASVLLMPQVGFLPPDDPRVLGTVAAIERELLVDGFVMRYSSETGVDALPAGEGAFLACSFWLADAYVLCGRRAEGEALFRRLLALGNDVGLYAEEYDPRAKSVLGNFPQALTHMALVNTARLLTMPAAAAQSASASGERPTAAGVADAAR
jgi:GH15 family glucan-1,4-alpha-glucosidase